MAGTVEIVVRTIDESSSEIEDIAEAFKESEADIIRLGKAFEQTAGPIGAVSDEFLKINPLLAEYKKLVEGAADGTKGLSKSQSKLTDEQKESEKAVKALLKAARKEAKIVEKRDKALKSNIKNLIKGLVGVSTVIAIGRGLANFAKDSFAAADAAGLLPPVFKEAEESSDRLKKAVGDQLGDALEKPAKAFVNLTNATAENFEITNKLNQLRKDGLLTQKEFNRLRTAQRGGPEANVRILADIAEREAVATAEQMVSQDELLKIAKDRVPLEEAIAKANEENAGFSEITAGNMLLIKSRIGDIFSGAAGIKQFDEFSAFREMLGGRGALDVRVGLGGEIAGQLDQIKLMEAGTLAVQNNVDATTLAYKEGLIDLGTYTTLLEQAAIQQTQIELSTGEIANKWQAAAQLMEDLNISQDEATRILSGQAALVDRSFLIPEEVRPEPAELLDTEGAVADVEKVVSLINSIEDKTLNVNIQLVGPLAPLLQQELE